MTLKLPASWAPHLEAELTQPYFAELQAFVEAERKRYAVYPSVDEVFNALEYTPYDRVKALLLGQDPYHGPGQAHGLCFSVRPDVKPLPPSLLNIYKEAKTDIGMRMPNTGCLVKWAQQGVLLLNTVLTVRAGEAQSHRGKGWELFTDAVIKSLNARATPVVFVLWGGSAQKKQKLIDAERHVIIKSAHPSPLSAHNGFFGSRPFSKVNTALEAGGQAPIDWQIADI